ncbi:MAG: NAD(P)-dependent oxidoreductase [Spirochaetota bacterium]
MKVGFIGLGAMGLPMAKNVIRGGHELFTMAHRRKEPAAELEAMGARVLDSPLAIARECEAIVTIVPADAQLEEVVFGENGLKPELSSEKVLVEMTTATSATIERVAAELAGTGVSIIDAPVSGGTPKAASGELTIIAGCEKAVLERYRPLLECMGTTIFHVGPVGAGKVAKMVNQVLSAVHMAIIGEAFALGKKAGADPETLADVIRQSSGYSRMLDLRLHEFVLADSFEPGFRLDLMKKDVDLAVDTAQKLNVPMPVASAAAQLFTAAMAGGKGGLDFSSVARHIASLADVDFTA